MMSRKIVFFVLFNIMGYFLQILEEYEHLHREKENAAYK